MKSSRSTWSLLLISQLTAACLFSKETELAIRNSRRLHRRQDDVSNLPIGKGDRFGGGARFPRGLGTQAPGTDLGSILNVKEVYTGFLGLATEYSFETFESPYLTYENATIFGGKIGGSCIDAYRVYLNGNIHARERGSADNILYFLSDLLYANKWGTGVAFGGRTYGNDDVRRALSTGIVFVPLSNPDGVAYDQATDSCWRKNRNPASATPGMEWTVGVDLNRNFDFLWDFPNHFHHTVKPASLDPADETYRGSSAFSEPETKSIKWVLDTFTKLRWLVDLHSVTGLVMYSWVNDENQSHKAEMNFSNSTFDSKRGIMPDAPAEGIVYSEYIPTRDWSDTVYAAMRTGNAMDASTGRHYEVKQSSYLYPASGTFADYAYSRHFTNTTLSKIQGLTIEFGRPNYGDEFTNCPSYPTSEQYHQDVLETSAGLMEFLLTASEIGLGDVVSCPSS